MMINKISVKWKILYLLIKCIYLTILNVYNKQIQLCILCSIGRLPDPTGKTDCGYEPVNLLCVSVDSWWAGKFTSIAKLYI